MIKATISVVSNRLPSIATKFDGIVSDALDLAVLTCIETADPLTRRDTGDLIRNKTIDRDDESRTINWDMEYAAYQNSGTVRMSGTNFADKGADAAMPVLLNALKGAF